MLQGFYFSPSTFPCCLYDTRLELTYIAVYFLPIYGVPVHLVAQGRTSDICRHLLFLLVVILPNSLVMEDPADVCPLSWRMMLPGFWRNPYSPHYRMTFAFSAFLCPLSLRYPLRVSTSYEGDNGVTTFIVCNKRQVRFALSAGSVLPMSGDSVTPELATCLLAKPNRFGLFKLTTFIERSHLLTMLSTLAPHPLRLRNSFHLAV